MSLFVLLQRVTSNPRTQRRRAATEQLVFDEETKNENKSSVFQHHREKLRERERECRMKGKGGERGRKQERECESSRDETHQSEGRAPRLLSPASEAREQEEEVSVSNVEGPLGSDSVRNATRLPEGANQPEICHRCLMAANRRRLVRGKRWSCFFFTERESSTEGGWSLCPSLSR